MPAQVRDYGNMNPDDPYFPLVRHKDFYAGHSWGSGLSVMVDGVYQESVSLAGGGQAAPAGRWLPCSPAAPGLPHAGGSLPLMLSSARVGGRVADKGHLQIMRVALPGQGGAPGLSVIGVFLPDK